MERIVEVRRKGVSFTLDSKKVALLVWVALVTIFPPPAAAYKRLMEKNGTLVRPVFGLLAGASGYSPASGSSSALMLTAGLRYMAPEYDEYTFHSLGFELTMNTWSSSTADVFIVDGGVIRFFPRTHAFVFDHHFFWGAGLGEASISRSKGADLTEPVAFGLVGLQGRVRDWYLEARGKFYMTKHSSAFDLTGFSPQLMAVYHFTP